MNFKVIANEGNTVIDRTDTPEYVRAILMTAFDEGVEIAIDFHDGTKIVINPRDR